MDFMVSFGLADLLFLLLLNPIYSHEMQAREIMQRMDAKALLEDFARSIDSVYLAGNNASGFYVLPETLAGGRNYTLRVYPKSVLLNYEYGDRRFYSTRIIAGDVNNTAYVELSPGRVRIRSVEDVVYIESE